MKDHPMDTHTHHTVIGYGDDRQCYVVTMKAYGGSIGVRAQKSRACADPTHAQRSPDSVFGPGPGWKDDR